jgi:hypothetical protein
MDKLEEGSRVAVVVGGEITPSLQNPPMDHLGNMAVIKKNVYINSLFAEPGQQVLRLKNPASKDFAISPSQTFRVYSHQKGLEDPFEKMPVDKFDYVMMINPTYFIAGRPPQLEQILDEKTVSLYRNVEQRADTAPEALARRVGQ